MLNHVHKPMGGDIHLYFCNILRLMNVYEWFACISGLVFLTYCRGSL